MIKKVHACNKMNFSSNINEAIRAFLISFFFLQKDFTPTKSTKSTKKQKKHQKAPKSTKENKNATKQKHKTQIRKQKLKMHLKNI